jgi:Mrp family chromosome partitioning ATPase
MAEGTPPRFKLTGTTAGSGKPREQPRTEAPEPPPPTPPGRGPARAPDSSRFRRGDVYPRPVVQGREVREGTWSRLRERVRELATSEGERREQALDRALREAPRATRTNTIAVVSPKGGVGKTTCTFIVGNLLAEALNLRVVASA